MALASIHDAPQHRPRPLPLFLRILREEAGDDPARTAAVLAGVRAYQNAPRGLRRMPLPIAAQVGRARLLDFGGSGAPVVFIPSLINSSAILDLDADRSLMRWLATRGLRPLLLDWGAPAADERELSIGGHVEKYLLPLLDALGAPVTLAGYCLGGTMALAAAALRPVTALALIATPWRFSGFPIEQRTMLRALWDEALPPAEAIGLLPMEVMQTAFWHLDPARTIDKFARIGRKEDAAALAAFTPVEDWANDGAPLTFAAARELIEDLFGADLTGRGEWRVGGRAIDPAAIDVPLLEIVSTTDRIVPAASALGIGERKRLALGHVGMIVGGRARRSLWQPLARWLSQPQRKV